MRLRNAMRQPAVNRQALAGAAGALLALLVLLPFDLLTSGSADLFEGADTPRMALMPGAVVASALAACLALAEEWSAGSAVRWSGRALAAGLVGWVLGAGYSVLAAFAYGAGGEMFGSFGFLGALVTRSLAWGVAGVGVGLTAGITSSSGRRAYQGVAGGALGGAAAGLLFQLLAFAGTGPVRLIAGLVLLGATVGAATALVELLWRSAWLRFLSGSREGRELTLYRDVVTLGRDELVEVPLFGDPAVERRHAVLSLDPIPVIRETADRAMMRVNGQPAREAALQDGALVEIGRHRFRFHLARSAFTSGSAFVPPTAVLFNALVNGTPRPTPSTGGPASPQSATGAAATVVDPPPASWLRAPDGARIPLAVTALTFGRDPQNSIVLDDPRASRCHARIDCLDGVWVVTDLGSKNGTRVNGVSVMRAGLAPGDRIGIGSAEYWLETIGDPWAPAGRPVLGP